MLFFLRGGGAPNLVPVRWALNLWAGASLSVCVDFAGTLLTQHLLLAVRLVGFFLQGG